MTEDEFNNVLFYVWSNLRHFGPQELGDIDGVAECRFTALGEVYFYRSDAKTRWKCIGTVLPDWQVVFGFVKTTKKDEDDYLNWHFEVIVKEITNPLRAEQQLMLLKMAVPS